MKFYAIIVTIIAFALLALVFVPHDNKWEVKYLQEIEPLKASEKIMIGKIKRLEVERDSLYGQIDSANTVIANLEKEIEAGDRKDAVLVAENKKLRTEAQPVIDANPKLKEFVTALDARINNLLTMTIDLKDEIKAKDIVIEKVQRQFKLQMDIDLQKDKIIENYKQREALAQNTITGLAKENSKLKKREKVWRVLSFVEGGVILASSL